MGAEDAAPADAHVRAADPCVADGDCANMGREWKASMHTAARLTLRDMVAVGLFSE